MLQPTPMYKSRSLAITLIGLFFFASCRREPSLSQTNTSQQDTTQTTTDTTHLPHSDSTLQPHDTTLQTVDTSRFTVDNTWECDIDGIHYSGTVDTAFIKLTNIYATSADTMITCTGTSGDKSANIRFRLRLNRYPQYSGDYTGFEGFIVFDTVANNSLTSSGLSNSERMRFKLDTLASNKLKATFSGTLSSFIINQAYYNPAISMPHIVSNGRFSCTFSKGNNEPKFFSFHCNEGDIAGVFANARLISNSLVLDGLSYRSDPNEWFQLVIRTGGTIKPGTYEGKNGDVSLTLHEPGMYHYFITDAPGNTIVIINSVSGNVVRGTFSAVDEQGRTIQQGKFSCRVRDYIPESDHMDSWQFNINEGPYGTFGYRAFGGNTNKALLTQDGSMYVLTVNGTSDHSTSSFKIRLHSYTSISTGLYNTAVLGGTLDELYYKSPTRIWNGNEIYMHANASYPTFCRIDAIDATHVEGVFYGNMGLFTSDADAGAGPSIEYGKFRASF